MFAGDVKAIAAGSSHSMVLKNNGDVWTTGYNGYGELGDGTTTDKDQFAFVIGSWENLNEEHPVRAVLCVRVEVHGLRLGIGLGLGVRV